VAALGCPTSELEVKRFSHKACKILKSLSKLVDSRSFADVLGGKMNHQQGTQRREDGGGFGAYRGTDDA
jgi:hypothetical protein